MNIKIRGNGIKRDGNKKYGGVKGVFCHIAWNLQDKDPTKVPNFSDLRDQSPLCMGTRVEVDLYEVTRMAEQYDIHNHTFAATTPRPGQRAVPPTGAIFHQSRCGSTLVSNVIAAFKPEHTRVWAEAPAPMLALMACDNVANCDTEAHDKLIQDVFYMMGRTPGPILPQYVFYKFQSTASLYIEAFQRAMPRVKWIFAYRDPVEILMSHFKNFQTGNPVGKDFTPKCMRNFGKSNQHAMLEDIVDRKQMMVKDLNQYEYCAAHLASLGESVFRQHAKAPPSNPHYINYNELPFKMWEGVLGDMMPEPSPSQKEHMKEVGHKHSKGANAGEHFTEDSTWKQSKAPEELKKAAALFMAPVYEKLDGLNKGT